MRAVPAAELERRLAEETGSNSMTIEVSGRRLKHLSELSPSVVGFTRMVYDH